MPSWQTRRRLAWIAAHGPCKFCGSEEDLQVDHIDRTLKITNSIWGWNYQKLAEELKNCQVLCRKCNLQKYHDEMGWPTHGASGYRRGCRCDICRRGNTLKGRRWKYKAGLRTKRQPQRYKEVDNDQDVNILTRTLRRGMQLPVQKRKPKTRRSVRRRTRN